MEIEKETQKSIDLKFCLFCGQRVDNKTIKCPKYGKLIIKAGDPQPTKREKIFFMIGGMLCFASICIPIFTPFLIDLSNLETIIKNFIGYFSIILFIIGFSIFIIYAFIATLKGYPRLDNKQGGS